ncbi:uncharacterized protein hng1 isoform X2 [Eurosta solidaginis]|uniref:uncharacterized protein hng1 isoform X2 n=1 Tax=Eurosta solidaginis TaxID=178769 RepID=UPI00353177CB
MTGHRSLEECDLALIGRVKMSPVLYDPRHPDFRLAYRKEQEWDQVGAMIGMSSSDARRRWTCLRDRYSRELKQLRLHPDKNEFGNNPFFRQMDFLRRYVRKRRTRRRNGYVEYDCQSADDAKMSKIAQNMQMQNSKSEMTDAEEEDDYNLQSYDDGHSNAYTNKIEEATMESEDYPEFVDDAGEVYEECVETPINEEQQIHKSIPTTQPISSYSVTQVMDNPIVPIAAHQQQQHHDSNRSIYNYPASSHGQHHIPSTTGIAHTQSRSHHTQLPQHSIPHFNNYQNVCAAAETEDDLFGKSIAVYLKQLSRRHKIKAQVEMFQILEKYIELEESAKVTTTATATTTKKN